MIQDEVRVKAAALLELRRRHRERMTFKEYLDEVSPMVNKSFFWDVPHLTYMRTYLDKIANGESLHPTKKIKKIMFSCGPQHGKLASHGTPVLTKDGWKTHGDIMVGDIVFGREGQEVKVLDEFNHGYADYCVEFSDGEKIKCHGNHEWLVYDPMFCDEKVVTTEYMLDDYRFSVDNNRQISFCDGRLTIHKIADKKYVKSISKIKPTRGKCITVEGGIYLIGKKLTPTHNSLQNTIFFTPFYLEKNIQNQVLMLAYNQERVNKFSKKAKDICQLRLKLATSAAKEWSIADGGAVRASGVNGTVTGESADLIIIDDPIKKWSEAISPDFRRKMWDNYCSATDSRIRENTYVILTQTRWHQDDLAGKLMEEEGDEWIYVNIPTLAEKDDILGRKEGETLWPAQQSQELILSKQAKLSRRMFQCLYQGNAAIAEGTMFYEKDIRYYKELPKDDKGKPKDFDFVIQSWDTAFSTMETSDYTVCATIGLLDECYYLIDIYRERLPYHILKDKIMLSAEEYDPDFVLIEKAGSGYSLIQELQFEGYNVVGITAGSVQKQFRAEAATPLFEHKKVMFPEEADWLDDFVDELLAFPASRHDDQVDALTMGLNYGRQKCTMGEMGIATV